MGSWGITMRESDYGLDLLDTIVTTQLKAADFSTFNVADTLEVIKADIMEEIRKANRGSSAVELVFYFSECFSQNFTHGVLLLAECLADYYRTGDLIVTEYVGRTVTRLTIISKNLLLPRLILKSFWTNCKASRTRSMSYINAGSVMIPVNGGWRISGPSSRP